MREIRSLQYDYTLPEVLKIKEWVDMMSALEEAQHLDMKISMDKGKG